MSDSAADLKAIAAVAADYVEGMVFGDPARLRRAFHPRACSIGHYEGATEWDDRDAFVAGCEANADPPSDGQARWHILTASVTGDTAVMQVEDDYLGARFTDTLTLLRDDGRWQIVAKVFWHHQGNG